MTMNIRELLVDNIKILIFVCCLKINWKKRKYMVDSKEAAYNYKLAILKSSKAM